MPKDFQKLQYQLAAHLRAPQANPPPEGLDDRRLAVYRRLFFRNINQFVSSAFPVLRKLYTEENWHILLRRFYAKHRCHSPYFAQVSREFLDYLQNEHQTTDVDPPFINELAHYERVELELAISDEEIDLPTIDRDGDLLNEPPVLSPLARCLTYRWPVHKISPDFQPRRPDEEPTCLVVCRNRDNEVIFVRTNPATNLLLEAISRHPDESGRRHIERLAASQRLPLDAALAGGAGTLAEMHRQDIILGTRKAAA